MSETESKQYKTVFVLGAGASWDFGFPTGEELLVDIARICNAIIYAWNTSDVSIEDNINAPSQDDISIARTLMVQFRDNIENNEATMVQFATRLRNGLPLSKSVDNFLHDQKDDDFKNFGKMIIAATLHKAEVFGLADKSKRPDEKIIEWRNRKAPDFFALRDTWFNTFFRELRTDNGKEAQGIEAFKNRLSNIAVITFNYERSFEYLMREAIRQYQSGISYQKVEDIMSCLKIIHPYGNLGDLNHYEFGYDFISKMDWKKIQHHIRIFMEEPIRESDKDVQAEAQEIVVSAEKIVFLGFGFHEQNMQLLGLGKAQGEKPNLRKIYATALNMSDFQRGRRIENLAQKFSINKIAEMQQRTAPKEILRQKGRGAHYTDIASEKYTIVRDTVCKELLEEYADDIFDLD